MMKRRIALLFLFVIATIAETKRISRDAASHQQHDSTNTICEQNSNNNIQCFCIHDDKSENNVVVSAECQLASEHVNDDDPQWESFKILSNASRVVISTSRNIDLTYVPTNAISYLDHVQRLEIKYGNISVVKPLDFVNLKLAELTLSNNKIRNLHAHGFSKMHFLTTINLDRNEISEINRDVFEELPTLAKLFLTSNKITTIHDKAFKHLSALKELELDKNNIFSLNSDSFFGLSKLQRLELSSNSLEIIGDDTFSHLGNLQYLNLDNNKIQMLDAGAFRGLRRLQHLSLGLNKLLTLNQDSLLEGLTNVAILSIRGNKLRELKETVMAPVINNFYQAGSRFEFEDNEFPCNCSLDWFLRLRNNTKNEQLKLAIENLNCLPDSKLSEAWKNLDESEKNNGDSFAEDQPQDKNNDYEYYDESQLGGKLFYIDVRDLLICGKSMQTGTSEVPRKKSANIDSTVSAHSSPANIHQKLSPQPNDYNSRHASERLPTTPIPASSVTQHKTTKIINRGVLNLSDDIPKTLTPTEASIQEQNQKKHFTTNHMVTVSAKPDKNHDKMYEAREMSSDEAFPDKYKPSINIPEEISLKESYNSASWFRSNVPAMIILIFSYVLL